MTFFSKLIVLFFHLILMLTSPLLLLLFSASFFFLLLLTPTASSNPTCSPSFCATYEPVIRFPFRLKNLQPDHCGYPGFDLSCNSQNQTILTLPNLGEFLVRRIDYTNQYIYINDPDQCLPRKLLNFSLAASPYQGIYWKNFTILNCTSVYELFFYTPIFCLESDENNNYTIVDIADVYYVPRTCQVMSTVSVPVQIYYRYAESLDLTENLQLGWSVPGCDGCEAAGGTCGFKGEKVGCSNLPKKRLSRGAKYGIIIGVGIPGLVCLIGFACFTCSKISAYGTRDLHVDSERSDPTTIPPQRTVVLTGLGRPTIESYPKTVLGESRRLPKPNDDGSCPICLAEYQPKETLRTIPDCNHYFHATCIDEWLLMNPTCPLCRNTPGGSSVVTPCTSTMSFSSSSTSSS